MSTVAEHLAELEMLAANGYGQAFASSAFMFTQVHWKDLCALIDPTVLEEARQQTRKRMLEQYPEQATNYFAKWDAFIKL